MQAFPQAKVKRKKRKEEPCLPMVKKGQVTGQEREMKMV